MGLNQSKDEDVIEYISQITESEKRALHYFIVNNMRDEAIALACQLINKNRKGPRHVLGGVLNVPSHHCKEYGVYMYELLKASMTEPQEDGYQSCLSALIAYHKL